jgi:hypothetical protein
LQFRPDEEVASPGSICHREPTTTVEDIEIAVTSLPPDKLAKFRAWFEEFEAARFDGRIERDARSRKLDEFAERALNAFDKGRARER